MSPEIYTTVEVARMTKIPRATLQHWIATRKIDARRVKLLKGKAVRLWSQDQIEKARETEGYAQARAEEEITAGRAGVCLHV